MPATKRTKYNPWLVLHCFVRRLPFGNNRSRGYWTDGTDIRVDGHTIAVWYRGAVVMYLTDPQWWPNRVARAIPKIAEYCAERGVLAPPKKVGLWCREHEDCRIHQELGRACAESRPEKETPPARVGIEKMYGLPLSECPHKPRHRRWESCLAATSADAARNNVLGK